MSKQHREAPQSVTMNDVVKDSPTVISDPTKTAEENEEITKAGQSRLPDGVQEHDANVVPRATTPQPENPRDPRKPPSFWKGGYQTCGNCGDFIADMHQPCPRCVPSSPTQAPDAMSATPKMMASKK